jgi:hypothetical protein
VTPIVLCLVGVWAIVGSSKLGFSHEWSGTIVRVLLGVLFVVVGVIYSQTSRSAGMKAEIRDVYEAVNMLLYGKNYRRDREAIKILLTALASEDHGVREKAWKSLKDLTGQSFALDAEVWQSWWAANEKRFALKAKRPDEK